VTSDTIQTLNAINQPSLNQWTLQDDPEGRGGADTTDESDGETRQHARRRREVLETAGSVFADADDEFGSLPAVKGRLEAWKSGQPDAYGSAYAADSVPAVFAPFVRNELLAWEPVFEDTPGPFLGLTLVQKLAVLYACHEV